MVDTPTETAIRQSYLEQAQLSQTHRWLAAQFDTGIEQSQLLAAQPRYAANNKQADDSLLRDAVRALTFETITAGGQRPIADLHGHLHQADPTADGVRLQLRFSNSESMLPLIDDVSLSCTATRQSPVLTKQIERSPIEFWR